MPTPRTVQITNPDLKGVAGRKRIPIQAVPGTRTGTVQVPRGWYPSPRAGMGAWIHRGFEKDLSSTYEATFLRL